MNFNRKIMFIVEAVVLLTASTLWLVFEYDTVGYNIGIVMFLLYILFCFKQFFKKNKI